MRKAWAIGVILGVSACAHRGVTGSELDAVHRPAFVSRIEDGAGPRSEVFRGDWAYNAKLSKAHLDGKEADRRLTVKLTRALTRFELSDRLRANTLAQLPQTRPWTDTLDPAQVAGALESFLVDEVPANAPDYNRLKELGADAVVEFVVEEYGMRSSGGKAGVFVRGYGRMFMLEDMGEIWHRAFNEDDVDAKRPGMDPLAVAKDPELYRARVIECLDRISAQFAKDLNPPRERRAVPAKVKKPRATGASELDAPSDDKRDRPPPPPPDELPPGELPNPD